MLIIPFFIIAFTSCEDSDEPVVEGKLIAHYPLEIDGNDITTLNGPLTLTNAPFQSGSVYCNGVYTSFAGVNPDGCVVQTPAIPSIEFESFAISIDFNTAEKRNQPVWVIGTCARWLGFALLKDGTIYMSYNNSDTLHTTTTYSVNKWHNAKVVYGNNTASIYLDNVLAGSINTALDRACDDNDTVIGVTNYSNGGVFKGNIKNLKVYGPQ